MELFDKNRIRIFEDTLGFLPQLRIHSGYYSKAEGTVHRQVLTCNFLFHITRTVHARSRKMNKSGGQPGASTADLGLDCRVRPEFAVRWLQADSR